MGSGEKERSLSGALHRREYQAELCVYRPPVYGRQEAVTKATFIPAGEIAEAKSREKDQAGEAALMYLNGLWHGPVRFALKRCENAETGICWMVLRTEGREGRTTGCLAEGNDIFAAKRSGYLFLF